MADKRATLLVWLRDAQRDFDWAVKNLDKPGLAAAEADVQRLARRCIRAGISTETVAQAIKEAV